MDGPRLSMNAAIGGKLRKNLRMPGLQIRIYLRKAAIPYA
jgi:hypothetical protein